VTFTEGRKPSSTSQAARELGVSLGTVRRWSDMGYLQSYRTPGGQRRFSVEHIEQFVRSLQQNSFAVQQNREDSFLQRATG
jgi:excisionase family DNA binding protein